MSNILAFAGGSVVRGGDTLLDDITWEVEEGERWVVLGPDGAGRRFCCSSPPRGSIRRAASPGSSARSISRRRCSSSCIHGSGCPFGDRRPFSRRTKLVGNVCPTQSSAPMARGVSRPETTRGADDAAPRRWASLTWPKHQFGTLSEGERSGSTSPGPSCFSSGPSTSQQPLEPQQPRGPGFASTFRLAQDTEAPALVLVTHHVEEIPPGFTDVLLLRDGRPGGQAGSTLLFFFFFFFFFLPPPRRRAARRPLERAGGDAHPGCSV